MKFCQEQGDMKLCELADLFNVGKQERSVNRMKNYWQWKRQ